MAVLVYRICPAVGIARVGDSDQHYLAPEKAANLYENPTEYSQTPQAGRVYRDNTAAPGKLLRQAVRFRIFEFSYAIATDAIPTNVQEVTSSDWDIRWTVELANKKSCPAGQSRSDTNRIFDSAAPGVLDVGSTQPVSIDRNMPGAVPNKVNLATLRPDGQGRLLIVPGAGQRGHLYPSEAEARGNLIIASPGWWDDLGDGPVRAEIRRKNTTDPFQSAMSAWVLLAPPAYAGPVRHVITLYDLLLALYRSKIANFPREGRIAANAFSFRADVYPLLHRASLSSWASANAMVFHGPGGTADFTDAQRLAALGTIGGGQVVLDARKKILDRIKLPQRFRPGAPVSMPPPGMPGPTSHHWRAFEAWVNDPTTFAFDWNSPLPPTAAIDEPAEITRCHLSLAPGGEYFPGMDAGGIVAQAKTWALVAPPGMKSASWDDAFRVDAGKVAGDLTASLAVPWQVDLFRNCIFPQRTPLPFGAQPLWPGARPVEVRDQNNDPKIWGLNSGLGEVNSGDAIDRWTEFGILRKVSSGGVDRYLDGERIAPYAHP